MPAHGISRGRAAEPVNPSVISSRTTAETEVRLRRASSPSSSERSSGRVTVVRFIPAY
jgi:hypothetical protein